MSELYDAIKKIESKEKKKPNVPDFSVKRESKPLYFLIVAVSIFFVFAVSTSLFLLHKAKNIGRKKSVSRKEVATQFVRKTVTPTKINAHEKPEKTSTNSMVVKKKSELNKRIQEAKVFRKPIKKASTIAKGSVVYSRKPVVRHVKKEVNKKVAGNLSNGRKKIGKTKVKYSVSTLLDEAQSGDFSTSVKAYRALIGIYPNNITLYNNLAAEYIDAGRYKEAVEVLKKALNIKDDPDIRINLAICYVKLGRFDLARKTLENVTPPKEDRAVYDKLMYILNSRQ